MRHSEQSKGTTIYLLVDPRESDAIKRVRYVGKTSRSPAVRYLQHCLQAKWKRGGLPVNNSWCSRWIRVLSRCGLKPEMIGVARVEPIEGTPTERRLIALMRSLGAPLTNLTEGGEGTLGMKCSPTTRRKRSEALKGRKMSPLSEEHKRKISIALKGRILWRNNNCLGRPLSNEHKRKIANALRGNKNGFGQKLSDEHKKKLAEALIGNRHACGAKRSDETKKKMSEAQHGRKRSDQTKRKISEANHRRKCSDETRRRLSEAQTGRKYSDESRKKISEARRLYWAIRKMASGDRPASDCHADLGGLNQGVLFNALLKT